MDNSNWLPSGHQIRCYGARDEEQVLKLVAADLLPGQPTPTPAMLTEALMARSPVDGGWWDELDSLQVDVLIDDASHVVGVVSFAARRRDNAGVLLWMHARERRDLIVALLRHVETRFEACSSIHAFDFATALSLGLEALPVRHRQVTHQALIDAGFQGTNLWRYMHRTLPHRTGGNRRCAIPSGVCIDVESSDEFPGWKLTARVGTESRGEVLTGAPTAGIGVLWWIEVQPEFRRSGLGRALLDFALDHLWTNGANQVILYVDDDGDPGGERDRTPANRLYDDFGFIEVDRLYSYTRHQ
jgi:ribosomal protein S18 acetylase RimI-like enzyme